MPALETLVPLRLRMESLFRPFRHRQANVRNLREAQVEFREIGQAFEVNQPGVGDMSVREVE